MAVVAKQVSSKLKLAMSYIDDEGMAKTTSKTFGNVRTNAVDADVYHVGVGLGSLQSREVGQIIRLDEKQLEEQA